MPFSLYTNSNEPVIHFNNLLGHSYKMKQLFEEIKKIAQSPTATVLILGESGTGKELVARAIHNAGKNSAQPFVEINCTALPDSLLETELFGYEPGAFTDARKTKRGLLELADGGTFFLDEIGDLNINLQAKLLKVLDERVFRRIGGVKNISVRLRIIAATNRDLFKMVQQGVFREDLYYRLNVISLRVPPLRERNLDILFLAEFFLRQLSAENSKEISGFSPEAKELLLSYPWPGNVRELKNAVERVVLLTTSRFITPQDLKLGEGHVVQNYPAQIKKNEKIEIHIPPDGISLEELEKTAIVKALKMANGNKAQAARLLRISREKLKYKLKKHRISLYTSVQVEV